jgi:Flp pilus assembly protein TadD
MRGGGLFVGREEEQERFRDALRALADGNRAGPSEAVVFLLYGHGGVGKSWLLRRFAAIASGGPPGEENAGRFVVAAVDWELEQRRSPAEFPNVTGPPIWRVLDRLYRALADAAPSSRDRRHVERAFSTFRQQMARQPALLERARALGLESVVGRRLSDDDRAQVADAVTQLAGAGLSVTLGAAGRPLASAGKAAATAAVRGVVNRVGQLEPEAYASLVSAVAALVRAFGRGLDTVGRKVGPVVLLLDTCELLGEVLDWMPELAGRGGSRVAWVLGVRHEVEGALSEEGVVGRLAAQLHPDRVVPLPLLPFARGELVRYLARVFPDGLPGGVTVERLVRATGGVPLAVWLVTSFLSRGHPADEVFDNSAADGPGRQVVSELMRRYLAHLNVSAESAADLPLVYGLALLVDGVDVQVLAALWDVPDAEVPGRLHRLRTRYDFVLDGSRPLHPNVATAVLAYLRGPVERESVRVMNERAATVLRARLPQRPRVVEARVRDEDWQRDVYDLVWHTFWADVRAGHRLLCHVFAPVAVLDAALALELTQLAGYFEPVYASADRHVLRELSVLASRPFFAEDHARPLPTALPAVTDHAGEGVFAEEVDRQRLVDMLAVTHGDLFGLSPARRLELAERLLDRVVDDGSAARQDVVVLHRLLTNWITTQHVGEDPLVDRELAMRAARRGVDVSPEEAAMHAVLGTLLLYTGQPAAAEAALREARRLDPHNPRRAAVTLGMAVGMQGRHAEAVKVLRKDVAGLPEDESVLARLMLGRILVAEGFRTQAQAAVITEAVDTLRVATRVRPDDIAVLETLVHALILNGEFGPAEITIRQALAVERRPGLLRLLGLTLSQLARLPEAVDAYGEAIELEPSNPETHTGLAATLGVLGDAAGAERESREAIRLDPGNPRAHENLAASLILQGRQAEAIEPQQRAAEIRARRSGSEIREFVFDTNPQSTEATDWLQRRATLDRVKHLMVIGADEEAIYELTELLDQEPTAPHLRTILGELLNKQGRFDEAESLLRAATAADPNDAGAHAMLASTLNSLGRRTEAVETVRVAAQLGADDGDVLGIAAAIVGGAGLHDEAIRYGKTATRLLPNAVDSRVNLALALRAVGRFKDAEQLLGETVAINERDADAYADLGEVQLFLGRFEAALRSLRRAAELGGHAGQTPKVHTLLGVLLRTSEPDRARTHFELAVTATRRPFSLFAHVEMQAIAAMALGSRKAASGLAAMCEHRLPTDTFRKPIYDLLAQPALPGLDAMIQLWLEIIAADPAAAGPFTLRPPK